MRFQYVLSEISAGLRRNLTMTLAVVLTVAISMGFLGTGLLMRAQADTMKDFWYDKVEISVFMCNEYETAEGCASGEVTSDQKAQIKQTLETHPEVSTVFEESQKEAYEHLKELDESLAASTTPAHLQQSFRVALEDPQRFDGVKSAVSGLPGVAQVIDQKELLEPVFDLLGTVQTSAVVVAIILVVAAVLLITNTIRLAAYNRRRETAIMRLVGAPNFYIQLPFILEAAVAGLIGAVLACGGVLGVKAWIIDQQLARSQDQSEGFFDKWVTWGETFSILPVLLIVGVALSAMSAMITLRRYLRV